MHDYAIEYEEYRGFASRELRAPCRAEIAESNTNFISKFISYNDRFGSRDDLVRMSGRAGGRP
jgi:hypothetical protein